MWMAVLLIGNINLDNLILGGRWDIKMPVRLVTMLIEAIEASGSTGSTGLPCAPQQGGRRQYLLDLNVDQKNIKLDNSKLGSTQQQKIC